MGNWRTKHDGSVPACARYLPWLDVLAAAGAALAAVLGGSRSIFPDVSAIGRLEHPTQGRVEQLPGRINGHSRWIPLHKIALTASFGCGDDHDGGSAVWGVVLSARGLSTLRVFNKEIGPKKGPSDGYCEE